MIPRGTLRLRLALACAALAGAALAAASRLPAQEPGPPADSLADLDIEQLARIRISSASRRLEAAARATAAVFVITRDDIRRTGATTLPDALRLAPGLQTAAISARSWAITSRGFAEQSPNKLLVLLDGRAIYSPLFAGVFWDVQDLVLADVERIEVILGPGATLWGSNAVNGVINVITRPATDTRGGLLGIRGGTAQHLTATGRYGLDLGATGGLRVYGRFVDRAPSRLAGGDGGEDDWQQGQGGFRLDIDPTPNDRLTLQGDVYTASGGQVVTRAVPAPPFTEVLQDELDARGANLLGRWTHEFREAHELRLQVYFDRAIREIPTSFGRVAVNTLDLDLQHRFPLAARHDFLWGVGYRLNADTISGTFTTGLVPNARSTHLVTAFAQDEITLARDRWYFTLGAALERNDFSGAELQPNVRLLWTPGSRHTIWSSVSRAVRIPSRLDADVRVGAQVVPGTPPTLVRFDGNEEFDSEELIALELGWRAEPAPPVSLDLSVYYHWYDRLRSVSPLPVTLADGFGVQPFEVRNDLRGHAYGGTLAAIWRPASSVLLRGSYTFLAMGVSLDPSAAPGSTPNVNPGFNPRHQGALRSSIALPRGVELDASFRYVGELASPPISDYLQADARLGWALRPELTVALVGRDLLTPRHAEFPGLPQREIQRRAELQLEWRF
ncbi:MAG: TonB-dependent receptor plug domain-containing protein [Gemmatimonadales bacterium]